MKAKDDSKMDEFMCTKVHVCMCAHTFIAETRVVGRRKAINWRSFCRLCNAFYWLTIALILVNEKTSLCLCLTPKLPYQLIYYIYIYIYTQ